MSSTLDYVSINKANWDERAPEHAQAPGYAFQRLLADPSSLSDVVRFDIPLLGDVCGLEIVHLQCHIGTDTISLARRGAKRVVGLDFSAASLKEARRLAATAASGDKLSFVEAPVYQASAVLGAARFDLVFTGIGALCWLPDIRAWAQTVAHLLRPGGRLFFREGHPVLWSIDEKISTCLVMRYPYFETKEPMVFDDLTTYVKLENETKVFASSKTVEWNHGLGEIVQALIDAGMTITGLVEHQSIPWEALPGQMTERQDGEFVLREGRARLPLSYTLQAVKGQ